MPTAVFIFHRDLRLTDNTSFIQAIQDGYQILPIFIFPPEQIQPSKNHYFSHPAVEFMCESLTDLNSQLVNHQAKLYCFKGKNTTVLSKLYKHTPFDAIYSNQDYSVYATQRDQEINTWATKHSVQFVQKEDYGLLPLKEGLVEQGTPEERPYLILAQFYNRVTNDYDIPKPNPFTFSSNHFRTPNIPFEFQNLTSLYKPTPNLAIHGGRTNGLAMLERIKNLSKYQEERNFPALQKTSKASPHLKFGTVSIREMYHRIKPLYGKSHGLIRELIFRDFYMKIYALYPKLQRGEALYKNLDKNIPWSYDKTLFEAWANGKTGYPLVDAGMRELNTTAHQHNRLRMLCGSVLTKYFLIDWREGLKYYYTHLVDADIYSNTAGWGFVSSTGPDGVPYFRAPFNPYIQSKKYDPNTEYIKLWVPELKDVSPKDIHNWFDPTVRSKYPNLSYPPPILDHTMASKRATEIFKQAAKS